MSTTKYEIMVIVQNDRKEAEAKGFCKEKIVGHIESLGGKITFEDFWGDRGFAYMIDGQKWGYYFVAQFDAEPSKIETLTADFNILKGLVRFLISKVDKKAPAPVKYEEMRKNWTQKVKEDAIADVEATPSKESKPTA